MPRSVVCISQTTGSGGPEVGCDVAEQLGYRCVDEEIIVLAAEREGVDPEELKSLERRRTLMRRFLETLAHRERIEAFAHAALHPEAGGPRPSLAGSAELRGAILETIRETAEQGSVVIVSHGASFALARSAPPPLRVFVTASFEARAQRVAAERELDPHRAEKVVQETDRARADYLRRFYAIRHEQPTHYDLVVNTDVLTLEQAAALIAAAARLEGRASG